MKTNLDKKLQENEKMKQKCDELDFRMKESDEIAIYYFSIKEKVKKLESKFLSCFFCWHDVY